MARIEIKCTEEEKAKIETKAKKIGLSTSAFIKLVALNSNVIISTEIN